GKTTLLRMVAGDLPVPVGTVARAGGLGVMRQFIGMIGRPGPEGGPGRAADGFATAGAAAGPTPAGFALGLSPGPGGAAHERLARAEAAVQAAPHEEKAQLAYANALHAWGEAGGYDAEVLFDTVATTILGKSWDDVRERPVGSLSGGEQKRFALELL